MNSELVKQYHITVHAKADDGADLLLSEHYGGEISDDELMLKAQRAKAAIMGAWPDWAPKQVPTVRLNWLHKNSMILM